jgi:hypothetical protein
MTTYVRTEEGQLAAYGLGSVLPRKMRTLLKVIDGKTPSSVYSESLSAFGNVQGVLSSLEMAGLIRPVFEAVTSRDAVAHAGAGNASMPDTLGSMGVQRRRIGAAQTHSLPLAVGPSDQAPYPSFPATDQMAFIKNTADNANLSQSLASAVDAMSTFVLAHAPEHSFLVLKELESLSSLEQLAVTLGGYEQLISHLGPLAHDHLVLVKQIIRYNM